MTRAVQRETDDVFKPQFKIFCESKVQWNGQSESSADPHVSTPRPPKRNRGSSQTCSPEAYSRAKPNYRPTWRTCAEKHIHHTQQLQTPHIRDTRNKRIPATGRNIYTQQEHIHTTQCRAQYSLVDNRMQQNHKEVLVALMLLKYL